MNNDTRPVLISFAASKVGRLDQTQFEHEILAKLVIDAVRAAGLDKVDILYAMGLRPRCCQS